MSSHQTEAITIADGEITVDAELLGLSAAALKAEMRKGIASRETQIYSIGMPTIGVFNRYISTTDNPEPR